MCDQRDFCVRNAGLPGSAAVGLRPVTPSGLGGRAGIEHDPNVYRMLAALNNAGTRRGSLDFAVIEVPETDPERDTRRLVNLDIQTWRSPAGAAPPRPSRRAQLVCGAGVR